MSKSLKAIIVIGVVVVIGATVLLLQQSSQHDQLIKQVEQAQASSYVQQGEVSADITNYAFASQVVKVKKGTTITWTNKDNAPHTVTSDQGEELDSPVMNQNDTFRKTFESTGVFYYHCTPHPNMIAAVIVVD